MRVIAHQTQSSQLELLDVPIPTPKRGDVLIRVACAGVNRPDLLQRKGLYPPPAGASPYMGLEVSGVIESISSPSSIGTFTRRRTFRCRELR